MESLGRELSWRFAPTDDSSTELSIVCPCVSGTVLVRGTWSRSGGCGPGTMGSQASCGACLSTGVLTGVPHPDFGRRGRGRDRGDIHVEI